MWATQILQSPGRAWLVLLLQSTELWKEKFPAMLRSFFLEHVWQISLNTVCTYNLAVKGLKPAAKTWFNQVGFIEVRWTKFIKKVLIQP